MKFRYLGDTPVDLPTLGLQGIERGDEIEAFGADAEGLGDLWKRTDKPARRRKAKEPDQPQESTDDNESTDDTADESAAPEES